MLNRFHPPLGSSNQYTKVTFVPALETADAFPSNYSGFQPSNNDHSPTSSSALYSDDLGQAADTPGEPISNVEIGPASGTGPRADNGVGEGAPSDHQGRRKSLRR